MSLDDKLNQILAMPADCYEEICRETLDLLLTTMDTVEQHHKLTTGQKRYIDTRFIKATRGLKKFTVLDHRNLLYPQYAGRFLDFDKMIKANVDWLIPLAKKELEADGKTHPKIQAHLEKIVAMGDKD